MAGSVLLAVGSNGISFLKDIIVADLTDLKSGSCKRYYDQSVLNHCLVCWFDR